MMNVDFCSEAAGMLELIGNILMIFKFFIPLIVIIYAIFDFYKSVVGKEEKVLAKSVKRALLRLVAAILIFFLPTLINFSFSVIGVEESSCTKCVLDTKTCASIKASGSGNATDGTENTGGENNSSSSVSANKDVIKNECSVEDEDCINYAIYIG